MKTRGFNDLPKDVVWLIFKNIIVQHMKETYCLHYSLEQIFHEDACFSLENEKNELKLTMDTLALIAKRYLMLIQSKVVKRKRFFSPSWGFRPGVITKEDFL